MSDKPIVGYCDGAILWHVDDTGCSWWGSPANRKARIAFEKERLIQAGDDERARRWDAQEEENRRTLRSYVQVIKGR